MAQEHQTLESASQLLQDLQRNDWTEAFVDPDSIVHGSGVRPVRDEGVSLIVDSIRRTGWDTNSLVLVYEDPEDSADPTRGPVYKCVDGMHRVHAVRALLADDDLAIAWPSSWPVDPVSKRLLMRVGVLSDIPSPRDIFLRAVVRNIQTGTVVKVSYVNELRAYGRAIAVVLNDLGPRDPPVLPHSKEVRDAVKNMMKQYLNRHPRTIGGDITMFLDLETVNMVEVLEDLEIRFGEGWFTRLNLSSLISSPAFKFSLNILSKWLLRMQNVPTRRKDLPLSEAAKGKAYTGLSSACCQYYDAVSRHCDASQNLSSAPGDCCLKHLPFIIILEDAIADFYIANPTNVYEKGGDRDLLKILVGKVTARHIALVCEMPAVPRIPAPSTSQAPAIVPALAPSNATPQGLLIAVANSSDERVGEAERDATEQGCTQGSGHAVCRKLTFDPSEANPSVSGQLNSETAYPVPPKASASPEQITELEGEADCGVTAGTTAPVPDPAGSPVAALPNTEANTEQKGEVEPCDKAEATETVSDPAGDSSKKASEDTISGTGNETSKKSEQTNRRSDRKRGPPVPFAPERGNSSSKRRRLRKRRGQNTTAAAEGGASSSADDDAETSSESSGSAEAEFEDDPRTAEEIKKNGENLDLYADPIRTRRPVFVPSSIPDHSAIFRVFPREKGRELFGCKAFPGDSNTRYVALEFHDLQLKQVGYTIVPDVFPEKIDEGESKVVMCQEQVDKLFDHFKMSFSKNDRKCCVDGPAMFTPIRNDFSTDCEGLLKSQRFQTPMEAIHQHLESAHPEFFELKLKLDIAAALLLRDLGVEDAQRRCSFLLPRTGGRLLLSAPGCTAQPPHTDYKVRFNEVNSCPAYNCSYFLIQTGRDAATLLVWPGSHHVAANFEAKLSAAETPTAKQAVKELEQIICGHMMPSRVNIPPYSCFVGRGDLVHAGDSYEGLEATVRNHIHCTSSDGETKNSIFIRPFGQ